VTAGQVPTDGPLEPLDRIRGLLAQLEQVRTATEHRLAADGDRRATAARAGDLGVGWKRVQVRIDEGRTTLDAVFGGQDTSPEAEGLRAGAREALAKLPPPGGDAQESLDDSLEALAGARTRLAQQLGTTAPGPTTTPAPAAGPSWRTR